MPDKFLFLMAGGGTGGHVIPLLAVANELRSRGHECFFVGTERGAEARLAPAAGFELELIRIGGLQGVSLRRKMAAIGGLVLETFSQFARFGRRRPDAIFSLGGYVAGPPVLAALPRRIPIVVMEPNAVPGLTNRWIGSFVKRALVNFPETGRYFPEGRTEVTGLPVREEFFRIAARKGASPFTVLITGGSQGSRTLNEAARASWPKLRDLPDDIYIIHQAGAAHYDQLRPAFEESGVPGEISAFIQDMPAAYARADLVICRSGAGAVSELAAAGKPSVLIPFPYATDDHQLRNAEQFREAGAALLYTDREWNGDRMFTVIRDLATQPERLQKMSDAARTLAHPGAARRAADILEEVGRNID
jgi:UDP-N-acetylglucosamine--N-acetylmuramyl-(pentapeptide) pyrophosphoryl-undecaprenol N-acetylglucosamine transferase